VLVHGLGGTGADIWKHQIPDLASEFRVVSYDLRGSGQSEVSAGPYSIGLLCDDLRALVDELNLGRVALVAHSMGGSIALTYAARYSGDVAALVGIGAPAEFPDQAREGLEARARTVEAEGMGAVAGTVAANGVSPTFREGNPRGFEEFIAMLEANDPQGYAAQCRALVGLGIANQLAEIRAPALLISGDRDGVSPPAVTEANAVRISGGRFEIVEDCGHLLTWERPGELADAAWPFLRESTG
jgi:pimeloyl-ACP methyl ester carboxylesterase